MSREIDIKDFAIRTERLCNRLLVGMDPNSSDFRTIKALQDDAADIQFDCVQVVQKKIRSHNEVRSRVGRKDDRS